MLFLVNALEPFEKSCLRYSEFIGEPIGEEFNDLDFIFENLNQDHEMYKYEICSSKKDSELHRISLLFAEQDNQNKVATPEHGSKQDKDQCYGVTLTENSLFQSKIFY